jgi:hypothetical protein
MPWFSIQGGWNNTEGKSEKDCRCAIFFFLYKRVTDHEGKRETRKRNLGGYSIPSPPEGRGWWAGGWRAKARKISHAGRPIKTAGRPPLSSFSPPQAKKKRHRDQR